MPDDGRIVDLPLGNEHNTRANFNARMGEINANAAGALEGLIANRPAPSALLARFIYRASDEGKFYWCTGTAWVEIAGGAPLADSAPPAIGDSGVLGASSDAAREDHTHAAHPFMARLNQAQTFTQDQSLAAEKFLNLGDRSALMGSDQFYGLFNSRWDGANWVRRIALNAASRWFMAGNGDYVYQTNSDAGNTVGSVITWADRWRVKANGVQEDKAIMCKALGSYAENAVVISRATSTDLNLTAIDAQFNAPSPFTIVSGALVVPAGAGGLYMAVCNVNWDTDTTWDTELRNSMSVAGTGAVLYVEGPATDAYDGSGGNGGASPGPAVALARLPDGASIRPHVYYRGGPTSIAIMYSGWGPGSRLLLTRIGGL